MLRIRYIMPHDLDILQNNVNVNNVIYLKINVARSPEISEDLMNFRLISWGKSSPLQQ